MGVRTDPLYLVLRIDNAVMLEANDYKVYLGLIKPVSVRIAEGESSNIGLEETTLKIKVSDTELPLSLYVRCECCGFSSKRILVGKIENMNIEPKILLGIPNYIGLLIIPDKPYLPSLLGRAFSLLGFPSSCVTNHPESRLFVELESPSRAQKLILRPRVTTE